jgi:hypothetical protein
MVVRGSDGGVRTKSLERKMLGKRIGWVDRAYRAGSKAGGEDTGDGMEGEPIGLEEC